MNHTVYLWAGSRRDERGGEKLKEASIRFPGTPARARAGGCPKKKVSENIGTRFNLKIGKDTHRYENLKRAVGGQHFQKDKARLLSHAQRKEEGVSHLPQKSSATRNSSHFLKELERGGGGRY